MFGQTLLVHNLFYRSVIANQTPTWCSILAAKLLNQPLGLCFSFYSYQELGGLESLGDSNKNPLASLSTGTPVLGRSNSKKQSFIISPSLINGLSTVDLKKSLKKKTTTEICGTLFVLLQYCTLPDHLRHNYIIPAVFVIN